MLNEKKYSYADIDYTPPEEEAIHNLFNSEEDAIFALYEQLFCNLTHSCPETILDGMRYLIFSKWMTPQMEEIRQMDPCDVDVMHHREIDKRVEEATQEMKKKLYAILEDKLF